MASGSKTRAQMLERVCLPFDQETPLVDEPAIKAALEAEGASCEDVAEALAEHKAIRVSRRRQDRLVIGADQILECEGARVDKPNSLEEAAVVALDGLRIWHATDTADLVVRPIDQAFIDRYLAQVGDDALSSVGAYQLEGFGAHLFTRVSGDFFTILGLPLLPLLDFLRARGAAPQ